MTTQRWMRALIIFQFAGVISGAIFARYEWTGLFFFQAMLLPATLTGLSIPVALLFILAKRPQLTAATGFLVAEFLIGAALVIALLPAIQ